MAIISNNDSNNEKKINQLTHFFKSKEEGGKDLNAAYAIWKEEELLFLFPSIKDIVFYLEQEKYRLKEDANLIVKSQEKITCDFVTLGIDKKLILKNKAISDLTRDKLPKKKSNEWE